LFGTFAIVKMIILVSGTFGVLIMKNTFASGYDNGLVAYWPLNTNANDYSINSNNGSPVGATSTIGKINGAYSFNGSGNHINVLNNASLNMTGTISIQAWVKWNSEPAS